ncbi:hypothetical protein [Parasitella parasitica]|uniref:UBA domain-containing protein n=1 Tax=Parasitella parasitica TaxID=35722 RepID=A0A0B7N3D9_9FUNG|nr:hypothetical protein [Parasitella parasitica]
MGYNVLIVSVDVDIGFVRRTIDVVRRNHSMKWIEHFKQMYGLMYTDMSKSLPESIVTILKGRMIYDFKQCAMSKELNLQNTVTILALVYGCTLRLIKKRRPQLLDTHVISFRTCSGQNPDFEVENLDAINQLQDLGVSRGQAKKALARYNNDVARAADYIFSGAFLSDDDDDGNESSMETDKQLALRLSREDEDNQQMNSKFNDNNNTFKETLLTPPSPAVTVENESVHLDKSDNFPEYDSAKWSVIPFKESDSTMSTTANDYAPSAQLINESSLTWWKDPENPYERMALDDLPIGLRPPSYNFAYSPVLVQALFHITAFQEAVLSFRPTAYVWGSPKNYWKGFGETVPGYIKRDFITKRQSMKPAATPESSLPPPPSSPPCIDEGNLISLDSPEDKMAALAIDDREHEADVINKNDAGNSVNEDPTESGDPPSIVESIPIEEETAEVVDHVESEIQPMSKSLEALAEMQKLFAFLGNTKRLYGSVSHYVRALNTKLTSSGWEFSDQTFEGFLDMMIGGLVEADEHSDKAMDVSFVPTFRSLFLLKARIEYGDDYENEEVYYLTISLDKTMNSFHGCLDPLVYESYETNQNLDNDADPRLSDEDEESYKLTTFTQLPPILMLVLENRTAPKKSEFEYKIDKTIYMDRYMSEKKDTSLAGFRKMEACRQEMAKSRLEMEKLKGGETNPLATDKRNLLMQTLDYFERKENDEDEAVTVGLDALKNVLNSAKDKIESKLQDLEKSLTEQKQKIDSIFDTPDMKENAYELRASFHHDGKSGTGHYWAYIWVEPSEESLLKDIPSDGGWFKFCDAIVTAATEQDMMDDPVQPFSLMYARASLPKFTKEQLYGCIPEELKDFIKKDNDLLRQEIHEHDHPIVAEGDGSLVSTSDDNAIFTEKAGSIQLDHNYAELDSSVTYDDNISVGTAVNGGHPAAAEYSNNDLLNYSFNGQAFSRLKDRVTTKIYEVSSYPSDDYRFIHSFDAFLARSQNQLILEHLYLLYSSEQRLMQAGEDSDLIIDETNARADNDLKAIWQEYDTYLSIASVITQALACFIKKDFVNALQLLMDSKRDEASWKTRMMLDMEISTAYSGLETLSFHSLIEKYGKECLKILNNAAFSKACNVAYRTRGLEDALHIAYHAQTVIGPDSITEDSVYQSLGSLWLSLTERIGSELTDRQAALLNNLIMAYLEGQVCGSSVTHSRSQSPTISADDDSLDNEGDDDNLVLPLWQKYKQVCSESEQLMKYIVAATVLSCLVLNNAEAKAASTVSLKSELAPPAVTTETATLSTVVLDSVQSLSSAGYAIEVPDTDVDGDSDDNSPALPTIPEESEDEDEEEQEDEETSELTSQDINARENAYSKAGLTYNKDIDLPVLAQRKQVDGEDLPAVPRVVACRSDGQIAITYSEGPSDATARIARQLNNAQTRANFFVNTKWQANFFLLQEQQYAMVLQNIYNAGHLIGLTYRLPTEDPETMSDEEIKADIIANAHMVESLIHVAPKYVRLHFSARSDARTEHILQELGFVLVGYNLDGKDYVHKTPELIEEEYRRTFGSYKASNPDKKGSFVAIQYDIPETGSMAAVPNIIQLLQKEGYDAVRMDGCLNDYTPYKVSAAGLEYVGDKFSLGSDSYKSGQKITAIINNSTAEEEIRGLSADDEFLNESAASLATVPKKIGYAFTLAFAYALTLLI